MAGGLGPGLLGKETSLDAGEDRVERIDHVADLESPGLAEQKVGVALAYPVVAREAKH